jgi:hypothetical protein
MVGIRASELLIGALCGVTLAFIFSQDRPPFWLRLEAALWISAKKAFEKIVRFQVHLVCRVCGI